MSVRNAGARLRRFRLLLAGAGAMNSPRYAPAGLLVQHDRHRMMLDGDGEVFYSRRWRG